MPDNAAAPAATPANFDAVVASNVSRAASTPTPAAAPATPAPTTQQPKPRPGLSNEPVPAFDAQVLAADAANDNARPDADAQQQLDAALADPNAADPFAEQVHGMQLRAIVDAIKAGQLPAELFEHIRVPVKPNGREMDVSLREAANGYMRISDYTQGTQKLAQELGQVEQVKGRLRQIFSEWDKPEGFEKGINGMGLAGHARALVTKNWGTSEQPNVQGYMDDMRRLGHWNTFVQAAIQYADQYSSQLSQFMGPSLPQDPQQRYAVRQRAEQMVAELAKQQDALWTERLRAEKTAEELQRKAWKAEQDQLLQQRRQQPQDVAQTQQRITTQASAELEKLGHKLTDPNALTYFDQNFTAWLNVARRQGGTEPIESLVIKAAQATAEQLADEKASRGQRPNGGSAAPVQPQAAPQGLPARPGAAPVTTAPSLPRGGDIDAFDARMAALNKMRTGGGR